MKLTQNCGCYLCINLSVLPSVTREYHPKILELRVAKSKQTFQARKITKFR